MRTNFIVAVAAIGLWGCASAPQEALRYVPEGQEVASPASSGEDTGVTFNAL